MVTCMIWKAFVPTKAKTTEFATASSTEVSQRPKCSKDHPHDRPKGGDKGLQQDTERNRHVHQLRRDRHSHNRSCRRPYSEILAQRYDQPTGRSDDELLISAYNSTRSHSLSDSDNASECSSASSDLEHYSPEPQVKRKWRHRSFKARSSRS